MSAVRTTTSPPKGRDVEALARLRRKAVYEGFRDRFEALYA